MVVEMMLEHTYLVQILSTFNSHTYNPDKTLVCVHILSQSQQYTVDAQIINFSSNL